MVDLRSQSGQAVSPIDEKRCIVSQVVFALESSTKVRNPGSQLRVHQASPQCRP
jgi:hypothetical protein